jgi:hypothetical protein
MEEESTPVCTSQKKGGIKRGKLLSQNSEEITGTFKGR